MSSVPDFMPILLSKGAHEGPESGACLMEAVSFLTGEEWSDTPACVDEELAYVGQQVNDYVDAEHRQLLLNYVNRFIGTAGLPVNLTDAIIDLDNVSDDDEMMKAWIKIQNYNFQVGCWVKDVMYNGLSQEDYDELISAKSSLYLVALDELLSAIEAANNTYAIPVQPRQLKLVQELLV